MRLILKPSRLKLPSYIAIFMFLAGIVTAGVVLSSRISTVNVSTGTELFTDMPTTLLAYSGDFYQWSYNTTLKSNQNRNITIMFNATSPFISNEDLKLRIMDENGTVLQESSELTGNSIMVKLVDKYLGTNEVFKGKVSAEWSLSAENTSYVLQLSTESGTNSFR